MGQGECCVRGLLSGSDFRGSNSTLCFEGPHSLSLEALGILTFGDLRIFWQSLEPGITFSEIGLAWLQDLSFRPRHNYSCSGSILATVTVLLGADTEGYSVPADEEGRCPSSEP